MGKNADEFADLLDEIDWNSASPESLISDLSELGIAVSDDAAPQLKILIDLMREVAKIDLKTATENFKYFSTIGENMKTGDIISEEDYQKLIERAPMMAGFFEEGVEGRYFIGDSD
jgi:hypothetical protein